MGFLRPGEAQGFRGRVPPPCRSQGGSPIGVRRPGVPSLPRGPRGRAPLGATKEVLGSIIDVLDFKEFLGLPSLASGFPRIPIRILA